MDRAPENRSSQADLVEIAQRGFRYALALTHDRTGAEDLVHEALVSLLRSRGPRTAPYFFTVIRSRFIDQRRLDEGLPTESFEDVDEARVAKVFESEEQAIDQEALERALARLRPQEREVLMLSCVEDLTCAQIAEVFGRPRGSVTSLLSRAQHKLRELVLRGSPGVLP